MAKRRRKKPNTVTELVKVLVVGAFLVGFVATDTLEGGAISFGLVGATILGIRFAIYRFREGRLRRSGIREIDQMDGFQFEKYLGLLFTSQGYKATVTQAQGDFGADLVLQKDGQTIVVQAKRYSKNVGIEAVQQVVGSLAHYGASSAWVVTNRDYTDAAYKLATSNNVRLINREALMEMVLALNPRKVPNAKQVMADMPKKAITCERCGSKMVVRNGANGQFYGCSSFPVCRNTKNMRG